MNVLDVQKEYTCFDRGLKLKITFNQIIDKSYLLKIQQSNKEISQFFIIENDFSRFYKFTYCGISTVSGILNENVLHLFGNKISIESVTWKIEEIFPSFQDRYNKISFV